MHITPPFLLHPLSFILRFLLHPLSFAFSFILIFCSATFPTDEGARVRYLMHRQKCKEALVHYLDVSKERQEHDFTLLREAALTMLREGAKEEDSEVKLMSLLAASICQDRSLLFVHKSALDSKDPNLQLASLSILGSMEEEEADDLLYSALSSPFLLIRLEALFHLARRGHMDIFEKMHSLFAKSPPIARPLFAQIISQIDTTKADRFIKQLLLDADIEVRIEMLRQIGEKRLDQFLPQVRRLAKQQHISQQEAALVTLSKLADSEAKPIFETGLKSPHPEISLAALCGLYRLGHKEALIAIKERAQAGDLFAITCLGELRNKSANALLYKLATEASGDVRWNAILALLQAEDEAVFSLIQPLLFKDAKDLGFHTIHSSGRSLTAHKIIPSANQNEKLYPGLAQMSYAFRQQILLHLFEMSEERFIPLAKQILLQNQKELVPLTVQMLENIQSKELIAFLEERSHLSSSELVRTFCKLALYRIDPKNRALLEWIKKQDTFTLIKVKKKEPKALSAYKLTYEESSQLFLEALEAIAMQKNYEGIETLLHLIAHGHEKNRYALAGLLIKSAE